MGVQKAISRTNYEVTMGSIFQRETFFMYLVANVYAKLTYYVVVIRKHRNVLKWPQKLKSQATIYWHYDKTMPSSYFNYSRIYEMLGCSYTMCSVINFFNKNTYFIHIRIARWKHIIISICSVVIQYNIVNIIKTFRFIFLNNSLQM